ncbi:unnamed protein product [Caenorhabditis brenneri]
MKFLLTVLLLVHTIQCLPEFSRDACLQTINIARAAYAEKFQIANMNSLNYNKKLEPVILQQLSFVNECPGPSIISHKNLDIYLNVRGQDDLISELLSGTNNTMLACVKSKCSGEDIVSIVTDKIDSIPITGVPGTNCPSDRLAEPNGLCALRSGKNSRRGFLDDILKLIAYKPAKELRKEMERVILEATTLKRNRFGKTKVASSNVGKTPKKSGSSRRGFWEGLEKLMEEFEDVNPPPFSPKEPVDITEALKRVRIASEAAEKWKQERLN